MFFVLSAEFTLLHASEGAEHWLTPRRRCWLEILLRGADTKVLSQVLPATIDHFEVTTTVLGTIGSNQKPLGTILVTVTQN